MVRHAHIHNFIHQAPGQMYTKSANLPRRQRRSKIGLWYRQGIEGCAVILDFHFNAAIARTGAVVFRRRRGQRKQI
jgi:hypothetical protein